MTEIEALKGVAYFVCVAPVLQRICSNHERTSKLQEELQKLRIANQFISGTI